MTFNSCDYLGRKSHLWHHNDITHINRCHSWLTVESKHRSALAAHVRVSKHLNVAPHTSSEALKGDFTTYPALICPQCNGYQGLSGNGVIKKDREKEEGRHGERDRKVGGEGRWKSSRGRRQEGRKYGREEWARKLKTTEASVRDNGDKRERWKRKWGRGQRWMVTEVKREEKWQSRETKEEGEERKMINEKVTKDEKKVDGKYKMTNKESVRRQQSIKR